MNNISRANYYVLRRNAILLANCATNKEEEEEETLFVNGIVTVDSRCSLAQ